MPGLRLQGSVATEESVADGGRRSGRLRGYGAGEEKGEEGCEQLDRHGLPCARGETISTGEW